MDDHSGNDAEVSVELSLVAQDEAAELREFELLCQSKLFKKVVTLYRWTLYSVFLRILQQDQQNSKKLHADRKVNGDGHVQSGIMITSNLIIIHKDIKQFKSKINHLMIFLLYLFGLLMLVRNLLIFLMLSRQGYVWQKYNLIYLNNKMILHNNVSSDHNCQKWQSRNWIPDHVHEWHYWSHYLRVLKAAYGANNANVINWYSDVVATGIIILLYANKYFWNRLLSIDYLNFLFDPRGERVRLRNDVSWLITCLVGAIRDNMYDHLLVSVQQSLESTHLKRSNQNLLQIGHAPKQLSINNRVISSKKRNSLSNKTHLLFDHSTMLINCLNKISTLNLVTPSNLTSLWHRKLTRLTYFGTISFNIIFCSTITNLLIFATASDLYSSLKDRMHLVRCFGLDANTTNESYIPLVKDMDSLSEREVQVYSDHDLSDIMGNLRLTYEYELEHIMNNQGGWFSIGLFITSVVYVNYGFYLFYLIYIFAVFDKVHWLRQIKSQIENIIGDIHEINYKSNSKKQSIELFNDRETNLMIKMMVAYLNYSLFVSRHRIFKEYGDFVIVLYSLVFGSLFVTCYYTNSYIEMKWLSYFILLNLILVLSVNVTWFMASLLFERFLDVNRLLHKLMALSIQSRLELSFPVDLFRQQLLEERDMRTMFAQRSIMGHTTMSGMLSMNAYLMAFWIIIFKY